MSLSVNERAIIAKESNEEFERLITEYRPFILGRVYDQGFGSDDDEISVALMAFYEAVKTYKEEKGNFLSYAASVIKYRLIDNRRKLKKSGLHVLKNEEDGYIDQYTARQQAEIVEDRQERRLEIMDFVNELGGWGMKLEQLAEASPKHKSSKELCGYVLGAMLSDEDLKEQIRKTKKLPVKQIAQKLGVSEKLLERHRRYLIAAYIIHSGGYQHLKDYVLPKFFGKEDMR